MLTPLCRLLVATCCCFTFIASSFAASTAVSILWQNPGAKGVVTVDRGVLEQISSDHAELGSGQFAIGTAAKSHRLDLRIRAEEVPGGLPTLVTVATEPLGFTFRTADVSAEFPIYLAAERVVITTRDDARAYAEIVAAIEARGGRTKLQEIAVAPEASFDSAAARGRDIKEQTWLGLSRDIRLFWIDPHLETIRPKLAGYDVKIPELTKQPAVYAFQVGRGWGARNAVRRQLDERVLPILRGEIEDEDIRYEVTQFVSLERTPLTAGTLRGTDYLVADNYGHGHMFTPEQAAAEASIHEAEMNTGEETVLYTRVVATNRGRVPRYAVFKTAAPTLHTPISPRLPGWTFDAAQGLGSYESGAVFAVSLLNGKPLPAEEVSILLRPGESAEFFCYLPHRPITAERAIALGRQNFPARLAEAQQFWRSKLASASLWSLPESRIDEMVRAGLLHLDLITYGREPAGTLLPAIGLYTAIGSESAPIIQFMDSMGWHDTAARAIDFFLKKQRPDGFMQNFNGYMLETGAVLWTMGEHYRYTRDDAWLARVRPNLERAADYLIAWRERNLLPELRGQGYGMLDGKTADPEDPYRSFMLNGYAYLGLQRSAEMLANVAPPTSARYRQAAAALKADILVAFRDVLARSPLVPLGDGSWERAAPPWTGYRGPVMLHADGGKWFTHGSMTSRDSLLGPLYLVFQEIIAPTDSVAGALLETHSELFLCDNVAFSQPYYSRHPTLHLLRGETKAFLQAWYGAVAALADRETYTFTEHFFPVSPHKTHEEAWFLMETRWMLYLESGDTLRLLSGVPRAYLAPGATVAVKDAGSYFGTLSFSATVSPDGNEVRVTVACTGDRRPKTVEMRLPRPTGSATGATLRGDGTFDPVAETVRVTNFSGTAEFTLRWTGATAARP